MFEKCCRQTIKITDRYALELLGFIKVDVSTDSEGIDKNINVYIVQGDIHLRLSTLYT